MTTKSKAKVDEGVRAKLLLWCSRHCCFCGKACTTNMEIHHIDSNHSNNNEDNLIPLCFDCHGELNSYNPKHPKGTKYRYLEIKRRREQIYDKYTIQYLRKADIKISNSLHHVKKPNGSPHVRNFGDISCTVRSLSDDIPIRLRINIVPYYNKKKMRVNLNEIYSGKALWNLNPTQGVYGHFKLPIKKSKTPFNYRLEILWSIIDTFEREHQMLPFSYVWDNPEHDWWFDPRIIYSK
jgi:5-methylcytosine-specific restriction endonuclease McrA